MGRTERMQEWDKKLRPVRGSSLLQIRSKEVVWLAEKLSRSMQQLTRNRTRILDRKPNERVRVSFPLRIGLGTGAGSLDSSGITLQLFQVKGGAEIRNPEEDSGEDLKVSGRRRGSKLGRSWEVTGNVSNAASVLLLSQAFCGPVVSCAMGFMALAEVSRFTIGKLIKFLGKESQLSTQWDGLSIPSRVHEFSAASLLLAIGVPLLEYQHPKLHYTLKCIGAALPVAVGYAQTKTLVKKTPVGNAGLAERLWRSRHRWAARRLYSYMTDFHHPPRIGWLVGLWEESTFLISGKGVIVASTGLPLNVPRKTGLDVQNAYKEDFASKQLVNVPRTTEAVDRQIVHHTVRLEDEAYDVLSTWNGGADNMYLEFSVVQTGWRRMQQRSSLVFRACYLLLVFGPLIIFGPVIFFISSVFIPVWTYQLRKILWWLLRFCLERGGAAFIKWGQWSATREDLFPEDMCHYLGRLHDRAPEHSYKQTRKAVIENLGRPIEDIFVDFPKKPCASGSIAQVYRAKLKDQRDGMPSEVAVKVRHPSVALRIFQDFQIMSALANWAQELPALRWLKLRESVDQFSHTLTAQADLRVEAENLARFHKNFQGLHSTVIFPKLIPDLVSEGVIVESFERGHALHEFLKHRSSLNTQIAAVGVDTYLKMMLTDNFVHTDLHPGNILARSTDEAEGAQQKLQLVLLDFGLAEELSPSVRHHFLSFIMMIGAGNGERAAYHLLQFSWPHEQTCTTPELLAKDMKDLFSQECNLEHSPIDLNKVLIKVLQLCRKHEVTIDSAYASLVVAVCVLVGFARSLDPELSIMDAAVPCLFLYNLTGRIQGRIYG